MLRINPELVRQVKLALLYGGELIAERRARQAPPERTLGHGHGTVADHGEGEEGVGQVAVGIRGHALFTVDNRRQPRKVADIDLGVFPIAVAVEIAAVAGGRPVFQPGPERCGFRALVRVGRVIPSGRQQLEVALEAADIHVPDRVGRIDLKRQPHHDRGRLEHRNSRNGLTGELAGLVDERGKAGFVLQLLQVSVLLDSLRVPEAQLDGLLERVQRLALVGPVGKRAGQVVVPGGILRHQFHGPAADLLHLLDVPGADRLHHVDEQEFVLFVGVRFLVKRCLRHSGARAAEQCGQEMF